MPFLIAGLALWSATHLFPVLARGRRTRIVSAVGTHTYRGIFAMLILAAVTLMVFGWRSAVAIQVFQPPTWGASANYLLMAGSILLFVASGTKSNFKRLIRHPQLTGVLVWGIGHVLASGSSRSLILFGGLILWAMVAITGINRRDGAWTKPDAVAKSRDVILVILSAIAYFAVIFFHPN